ncbi:Protein BONZAI 3 [Dichanthelium oligosanthes]|uniref:Protein BONZAI 3 n=1 Tax=Dichanthelium oligosanthes TaxID=888268 RepID=A0A1E5WA18_9POAL|nr:Protein BONZAI 3 [Dichanthelium oligosanthes]
MGGCFSVAGDVRGGMEAVGGGGGGRSRGDAAAQQGGPNDAVDYFFQTQGLRGLYTPVELSFSATKLRNTDAFSKTLKLDQQDFLGEACCNLSEIVTKFDHSLTLNLRSDCGHGLHGTMTVHAEESDFSRMAVEMTLHCLNLENKDVFSKSDPFLRISKLVETAGPIPICKTEVVTNNLNPVWRPITLTSQQYGSKDNPLLVECFDFESSGNHELIGAFQTTITQLENLYTSKSGANFYSHKGQRKMKGQLFVDKLQEKVQHTFLDYISSGFELNFMVAVDFTASNGDPRAPQSLHYIDPSGRPNSYQQVRIFLQFYDNDRRFPAWGFGAKTQGHISHCFNLNTATNDCEVVGVEGIMSAYTSSLYSVSLAGPTMFGPVINKAAEIASQSLQYLNNKYFVLLIITDGVLTDIQETKDTIVRASDLPLSILIVGVGNADFKQMEILDADNGKRLESSTGRIATRDIVQFVPMRDVQGGQISVVQSLLEELPGQFLHYMRARGIKPQQQAPPGHDASAPVYPQHQ